MLNTSLIFIHAYSLLIKSFYNVTVHNGFLNFSVLILKLFYKPWLSLQAIVQS